MSYAHMHYQALCVYLFLDFVTPSEERIGSPVVNIRAYKVNLIVSVQYVRSAFPFIFSFLIRLEISKITQFIYPEIHSTLLTTIPIAHLSMYV